MIKKTDNNLVLICDICGETLQDPDECTLLEMASSRGWIAYHSNEPHKEEIKFVGRNSIHLCSMGCEKKLLDGLRKVEDEPEEESNCAELSYYHPFAGLGEAYQESVGFDCVPTKITLETPTDVSATITAIDKEREKFVIGVDKAHLYTEFVCTSLDQIIETLKDERVYPVRRVKCDSGVIAEPKGCWLMGCANSRISKTSLVLQNGVGIIDPDYRGTIRFNYWNLDQGQDFDWLPVILKSCGQLVSIPRIQTKLHKVERPEKLSKTERGQGGFGSSAGS